MAAKPGVWNPTTAFLPPLYHGDEVYQEPVLDRATRAPRRGLPGMVPYTYRGSDHTIPPEPATATAAPPRRTARKARPWHDPEWLTGPPVSAPPEWIREYELQARGGL